MLTTHEPILVCTVGNPRHKAFPSTFDGVAREHSRKPDEFYDLVLSHTPKAIRRADLFSRQTRPGFQTVSLTRARSWSAPINCVDIPASALSVT